MKKHRIVGVSFYISFCYAQILSLDVQKYICGLPQAKLGQNLCVPIQFFLFPGRSCKNPLDRRKKNIINSTMKKHRIIGVSFCIFFLVYSNFSVEMQGECYLRNAKKNQSAGRSQKFPVCRPVEGKGNLLIIKRPQRKAAVFFG